MLKKIKILLVALVITMVFGINTASADTEVFPIHSGSSTYYKFIDVDHWAGWGVNFETRIRATSRHSGSGSVPLYLSTYYTDQRSSYGTTYGQVKKSWTTVYDPYNNKEYDYNTFCDVLYNADTIYINKYLGWSSSKNPYVSYNLAPNDCYGGNYVPINHVLVNNY